MGPNNWPLLDRFCGIRKCGFQTLGNSPLKVLRELGGTGCYVSCGHVYIVLLCDRWRTVPHEASEAEFVHSRLRGPGRERMPPTIELERLKAGGFDCVPMWMLETRYVPGDAI